MEREIRAGQKAAVEWKWVFESEEFEAEYGYAGGDLGAVYGREGTVFRVWAPTAVKVAVSLYGTGSDEEVGAGESRRFEMVLGERGVWSYFASGDLSGVYYTFLVEADGVERETADVYAKAAGVNGKRSMVVDLAATDPEGWEDDRYCGRYSDRPVIYEVHVKDFSNDVNSGVRTSYRGKYLAFTEQGTYVPEQPGCPTCVDYLKELGITHVHLLPVYDYGSVDESGDLDQQFNWGYDPVNYNVPEGSYSTDPYHGEVRIREFKQMVKALHDAGIAVVMDVVYNHTYSTQSWFQYTVPYYYYRVDENGEFSNGSVCSNDTASERIMYRKYMIDSVRYWAEEYHIDGFRFDLMGLHDVETMNEIRRALDELPGDRDILMYGEPWSGGPTAMKEGCVPAIKANADRLDERILFFCDSTRDSIKGSVFFAGRPGFVNGGKRLAKAVRSSVQAWCTKEGGPCDDGVRFYPKGPGQVISYVSAHDNYSLWDKLVYTGTKKPQMEDFLRWDEELLKQNRMAAAIYFTCLGTPFFQAGEEGARTKQGVGDSFSSPARLNQLDWERIYRYEDLVRYYRGLILLRKHFGAFFRKDKEVLKQITFSKVPQPEMVIYHFSGDQEPEDWWEDLFVVYNGGQEAEVTLPKGSWDLLCDGKQVCLEEGCQNRIQGGSITAPGKSVLILGRRNDKAKGDEAK